MTNLVRATGFPAPHLVPRSSHSPGEQTLPCATLVDRLADALNLTGEVDSTAAHQSDREPDNQRLILPWLPHPSFDDYVYGDGYDHGGDALDLPRLFAPTPAAPKRRPGTRSASPLSGRTVALGFVIGLAVAGPITGVAALRPGWPDAVQPSVVISTLAPASTLTPAQDPDGIAAFDEASLRLARGDYIGARDLLRRAVAAGEDRARMLLDALD
jgi:hypothetical protein